MTDLQKILLSALLSTVVGATSGYLTGKEQAAIQVNRLEERQSNQYNELRSLIRDLKDTNEENAKMIRDDFNGVRGEIMNILRVRNR